MKLSTKFCLSGWTEEDKFYFSDRVDSVIRIIQLRREGFGTNKIAKALNDEGHRPLRSTGWNHTTVGKTINSVCTLRHIKLSETTKRSESHSAWYLRELLSLQLSGKEEFMLLQSDQKQKQAGYKSEHNVFAGILKHRMRGSLYRRKFHTFASGKHINTMFC